MAPVTKITKNKPPDTYKRLKRNIKKKYPPGRYQVAAITYMVNEHLTEPFIHPAFESEGLLLAALVPDREGNGISEADRL